MNREEKRNRIDSVLRNLMSLKGVTAASIVDPDGLTIQIRHEFEIDVDAMSASVLIIHAAADQISQQVEHGDTNLIISECNGGLILVAALSKGFMLAVVSNPRAMLGTVRYEIKESISELSAIL